MDYRTLGRTGLNVSVIGFGSLSVGRNWPNWRKEQQDFSRPDEAQAIALLRTAVDAGVNFFDTAPAYFKSEGLIGKAFKGIRDKVIIGTKCGEWFDGEHSVYNYGYDETKKFIENSLQLLQTDYIDLLQIHSASADVVRGGETIAAMKDAQREGKVRFLGLSTEHEDAARLAIESHDYDTLQISHNLLKRMLSDALFPLAEQHHVGIIVKDSLAQGKLTEKFHDIADVNERERIERYRRIAAAESMTLPDLALRFSLTPDVVSTVIVGTKNADHFRANVNAAAAGALSHDLVSRL
jgi:aryl-alcohol dehydrogenase-like predicted oxidoreductase